MFCFQFAHVVVGGLISAQLRGRCHLCERGAFLLDDCWDSWQGQRAPILGCTHQQPLKGAAEQSVVLQHQILRLNFPHVIFFQLL